MQVGLQSPPCFCSYCMLLLWFFLVLICLSLFFQREEQGGIWIWEEKGGITILSDVHVGCIACLLLFRTYTACLGLICFSFISWPGFTLFLVLSLSSSSSHSLIFLFRFERNTLEWPPPFYGTGCSACISHSLSSLVLVQNHLSHFHQSFSLSITGEQAGNTSTPLIIWMVAR